MKMSALNLQWKPIQKKISDFIQDYFSWKIIAGFLLFLLMIIGLWKSCSSQGEWRNRSYKIAYDPTWYPLNLVDKSRNMQGFVNELFMHIAELEKIKIDMRVERHEELMSGLDSAKYSGVLLSLMPNDILKRHYLFSDPIYLLGPVLIVKKSSNYRSLDQIAGKMVGTIAGSSLSYNLNRLPSLLIRSYDTPLAALSDLERNAIDGVILDILTAHIYTGGYFSHTLKMISTPLTDLGIRLVMSKGEDDLNFIEVFNRSLKVLQENGTFDALLRKWGLFNTLKEL